MPHLSGLRGAVWGRGALLCGSKGGLGAGGFEGSTFNWFMDSFTTQFMLRKLFGKWVFMAVMAVYHAGHKVCDHVAWYDDHHGSST